MSMGAFLRGDLAVPILITKCYVRREPKITKRRRFVGFKQGIGTLVYKSIELFQDCFWNEEQDVEDIGETDVVNYAIDVLDDPGQGRPELIVTKLDGQSRPASGFFIQIISPHPLGPEAEGPSEPYAPPPTENSSAKMVQPKMRRPGSSGPLPSPERL